MTENNLNLQAECKEPKAKRPGRWAAGVSGNPRGKKPGSGQLQKIRNELGDGVPALLKVLMTKALEGDAQAARLILERVLPALKPLEQPLEIQLPQGGTLVSKAEAVLSEAAAGVLAPSQAATLIGAIAGLAKIIEIDDLAERISRLEANQ